MPTTEPVSVADHQTPPDWEEAVLRAVRAVRYGSVEITIHDAQVVQVERRERLRFPDLNQKAAATDADRRPAHRSRGGN